MRTTIRTQRSGRYRVGTALGMAALAATLGGCGLASGGIKVVGANPRTDSEVPFSVVAQSTDTAGAGPASAVTGDGGPPAKGGCTATALRLGVTWAPTTRVEPQASPSASERQGTSGDSAPGTMREQLTLVFTNVSTSPCVLRGFPSVDFLRAGEGGPLSEPDTLSAAGAAVADVELKPGSAAIATATFVTNDPSNARGSGCDNAVTVRSFLPGLSTAISSGVRNARGEPLPQFYVCGHGVVVSALRRA